VHVRTRSSVLALGLLTSLVGCASAPTPAETIYVTAAPKPAETVYVTVTPEPPAVAAPADPVAPELVPNAPAPVIAEGPANDTGAIPGAGAAPTLDGNGNPVSYSVIAGDSFFDIAQRFEIPQQQLLRMNPSIPNFGETVYIGQVINLDWTKQG